MNLKEIGVLLASLYGVTILLMAYKYYNAKGGVFHVARLLVVKYILRFSSLLILLFLCYQVIVSKQVAQTQLNNKPVYLVAVSTTNSSLTWNNVRDKVNELSPNGQFGLIQFDPKTANWNQIIPNTNKDSFFNLIEHARDSPNLLLRKVFTGPVSLKLTADEFTILHNEGKRWTRENDLSSEDNFLSKNIFISWLQATYVPLYLVILLLALSFIDIVFPIKALKI